MPRRLICSMTPLVVLLVSGSAAWATTLGISSDGRFFSIDGVPTYLNGVSYYGSQTISTPTFVTQDLDDMVAGGFNWIRVWGFWEYPDPSENVSIMTQDGTVREPYMTRLKTLIAECNSRGMIVDVSLRREAGSARYPSNLSQHLACVQTLAQHLLSYRNVYIDVANERDVGDSRYVSLSECGQIIAAIKAIDPGRLCTASGVPSSQAELDQYRTAAHLDFMTPHLGRDPEDPARTVNRVGEFITWMGNLGFRFPIHLQEPFRRGYSTTYNPVVEDYYRDCSGGKIAEAAGWCLHNGNDKYNPPDYRPWRCFNMTPAEGRLYSQWDSVEQAVIPNLDGQIGGTSMNVRRYQAEYPEHLPHQTGARDGWTWSANVASHSAGYLSYGPYITTVPTGKHLATWRLRIDNISGGNDVVATIDVVRNVGAQTLASRQIRRQDFAAANAWQDFSLPFSSNAGDNLEFRTYWPDVTRVDLDWVTLTIGSNPQLAFTDITGSSGTGGPDNNGEYGGHGVMWADVTGDARPDFYVTMIYGSPMAELFYRNVNGATFSEEAAARGIDDYDNGSHGGTWADLDNDGDYDLVNGATYSDGVTYNARNEIYENNGSGGFTNRTAGSGFEDVNLGSRGISAFDFDKDGDLDVFINNWGPSEENEFYRNNGGWNFTRIDNGLRHIGGVQGVTEGDFDNDGDLDLLVGQGYGTMGGQDGPLMVMRNTGGSFSNVTSAVGLSSTGPQQQGSVFRDINNDGWLDLHVQRDTGDSLLYLNDGDGTFTERSVADGLGFMANFEDLDNDGDWDMVYAGDNKVYLNDGSGNFTPSSMFSLGTINDPRAVAFADIDDDGDVDFFYAQKRTHSILIRNDLTNGGNWLKVRLLTAAGQAGAFGARVKIYEPGNAGIDAALIAMREAHSNEGYLGQNDPVLHFGTGPRTRVDVQVRFLDGTVVTRSSVAVNQTIIVDAGAVDAPVIAEVTPDPDATSEGQAYTRQLALLQGTPPVTWSVLQGPSGTQVNSSGLVSGWTAPAGSAGTTVTFTIRATNSAGQDDESWQVTVESGLTPVFEDDLRDTSKISGQYGSGAFSADGYALAHDGGYCTVTGEPRSVDYVWYDRTGSWAVGSIEFDVSGLYPGAGCETNELMLACDSTGLNPAGDPDDFYASPCQTIIRKLHDDAYGHTDKMKIAVVGGSGTSDERSNVLGWSGATTYRFRMTWNGSRVRWYRGQPGSALTEISPPSPFEVGTWSPQKLHIQLGATFRAGIRGVGESGGTPGTLYSLLRIYDQDLGGIATPLRQAGALPPIVAEVSPDPDIAAVGTEYVRQLELVQGSPPTTWSVVQGPAGLQVDASGRVSGWTPTVEDAESTVTLEVRAANALGEDTEAWQVRVVAVPEVTIATFPFDAGAEGWTLEAWKSGQYEPGTIAWDASWGNPAGHVRSTGSGVTNSNDSCTREGSRMTRVVSTANHSEIQVQYDVLAVLDAPPVPGCSSSCLSNVLGGSCEDKLVVSYSVSGTDGPWLVAQALSDGVNLPGGWTRQVIDLSDDPAVNDKTTFALRFEWQFNTSADSGRIDNVVVLGNRRLMYLADQDADGDVDQGDFGYFQACLSGSNQPYSIGCSWGDFNGDGDVDQEDLDAFRSCMAGPQQAPACQS